MGTQTYLIALGSNRRTRWGTPERFLQYTAERNFSLRGFVSSCAKEKGLAQSHKATKEELKLVALSRVQSSRPLGPSVRCYANAVAAIETPLDPPALLAQLKAIERSYGRRPGRRWGDRPLDLDIIGWSGGMWASQELTIPHPEFRQRRFVLAPLVEIAPDWCDPVTHLTARQLLARLDRKRRKA